MSSAWVSSGGGNAAAPLASNEAKLACRPGSPSTTTTSSSGRAASVASNAPNSEASTNSTLA